MILPVPFVVPYFQIEKFVNRIMQLTVAKCVASVSPIVHHRIAFLVTLGALISHLMPNDSFCYNETF